jgi:hypothetical protein
MVSCRASSVKEVVAEDEIGGDPSLLRDRLPHRDRVSLESYRDARAALALIREAIGGLRAAGLGGSRRVSGAGVHGGA